ncbi:MAG: hypothetical protein IJP59_10585 [Muribaculaceae bacterium]|nr:hypothetical protein [Muribaculaceae bacterium]
MKKILFIVLALMISMGVLADDVIVLTDATEINCKIVEVGDGYIKYKRSDNPNGPTFNQNTKGVFYVKYENGEKVNYNTKSATGTASSHTIYDGGNEKGGFISANRASKIQVTPHCGVISALYGSGYKTQIPPVGLDIEWLSVPIGGHGGGFAIGVSAQYSKYKLEDALFSWSSWGGVNTEDAYLWSIVGGVIGSYNYYFSPKFEVFGTVLLGYEYAKAKFGDGKNEDEWSKYFDDNIGAGGFAYNVSAGVRYHFTPSFNVRAQLGYGVSVVDVGLGFRF